MGCGIDFPLGPLDRGGVPYYHSSSLYGTLVKQGTNPLTLSLLHPLYSLPLSPMARTPTWCQILWHTHPNQHHIAYNCAFCPSLFLPVSPSLPFHLAPRRRISGNNWGAKKSPTRGKRERAKALPPYISGTRVVRSKSYFMGRGEAQSPFLPLFLFHPLLLSLGSFSHLDDVVQLGWLPFLFGLERSLWM